MLIKLTLLTGNVIYVNVNDIEIVEENDYADGKGHSLVSLRNIQYKLSVKEKADEIHFTILNQQRFIRGIE